MKVSATITVPVGMTVGDLLDILEDLPRESIVRVASHQGDRFSSDWHTIEFSWEK